jgi:hypothetical protein
MLQNLELRINKIINSILTHRQESENGNFKIANKHIKFYTKEICKIMNEENSISILGELIKSQYPAVRSTAAYFLLPYNKEVAEKELNSLSKEESGIGFNAKMIMKEWKKKTLKFPSLVDGKIVYTGSACVIQ